MSGGAWWGNRRLLLSTPLHFMTGHTSLPNERHRVAMWNIRVLGLVCLDDHEEDGYVSLDGEKVQIRRCDQVSSSFQTLGELPAYLSSTTHRTVKCAEAEVVESSSLDLMNLRQCSISTHCQHCRGMLRFSYTWTYLI